MKKENDIERPLKGPDKDFRKITEMITINNKNNIFFNNFL